MSEKLVVRRLVDVRTAVVGLVLSVAAASERSSCFKENVLGLNSSCWIGIHSGHIFAAFDKSSLN